MTIALISDIHGNTHALEAVFEHMDKVTKPHVVYCLGDLVNYGAHSAKVIKMVRQRCQVVLLGNHDAACSDATYDVSGWGYLPQLSLLKTKAQLSHSDNLYLASLPRSFVSDEIRFVHGVPPNDIDKYTFEIKPADLYRRSYRIPECASFVGHSHYLEYRAFDQKGHFEYDTIILGQKYRIRHDLRTVINIGSVGQPRDHTDDLQAKYMVYDPDTHICIAHTVPYDAIAAAQGIVDAGYPLQNAYRLLHANQQSQLRIPT